MDSSDKKKVVVLGATGGTGSYLTDYMLSHLDREKYEIIAAGRRKTNFWQEKGVEYYSVDIADADSLETLPKENVYAVVLESGLLPAGMEGYHPEQYLKVNTLGALNVLEYCRKNYVDRILYTQTIREIGVYLNTGITISPDLPRNFSYTGDHAVYVISKNAAVDLIRHYQAEYGLKGFIFRLPNIYIYKKKDTYYLDGVERKQAYRLFIERAIRGEPIEMWGDPTKAHDVVYVKDFCQMLTKAVLADCNGGLYHVGTGNPVTLKDQIEGIVDVFCTDKKSEIILCPEKPNARSYTMDISNAVKDLGYQPAYDYMSYLYDFKEEMELNRFAGLD